MRTRAAVAALSLICLASSAARADPTTVAGNPSSAQVTPSSPTTAHKKKLGPRRWYGWQVAAVDAPVWLAAWKAQPATMGLLGSGPVVHLLHGEPERAQASLAVRLVGAMFGAGISGFVLFDRECPADRTTCPPGMSTIMKGAAIGLGAAELVDVLIIGWTSTAEGDEALPPIAARRPPAQGGLLIGDGSVVFALSGSF